MEHSPHAVFSEGENRLSLKGRLANLVRRLAPRRQSQRSKQKPSPTKKPATVQHPEADRALKREAAWKLCEALARSLHVLDRMVEDLCHAGVAGEDRAAKLVYLVLTSRLLDRPLCAAVKGPSSAGKSHLTSRVLSLFPPSAAYSLTGMSEHALAYSEEPLSHRIIVIAEAAGLQSGQGAYFLRSLISEGRLRYETVEIGKAGPKPRIIEREGPTGLLVTTTALNLDQELETRLFSIPIDDGPEQTRAVLTAIAVAQGGSEHPERAFDPAPWRALQDWLECSESRVVIPYAPQLAAAISPIALRLRRDFTAILSLIEANALLHQCSRERDEQRRVVATNEDYAAVYELVADIVSEGVEATVPQTVREMVEGVRSLMRSKSAGVSQQELARKLKLHKSVVSRHVEKAKNLGYLVNEEARKGKPARLVLGDPLPVEVEVLPQPEVLQSCSVLEG